MRIGVRAHDFGKLPAEMLARKIAKKGLQCIQLTLDAAIAGIDDPRGRLSPGLARGISDCFSRRGIQIAVLSCYINPIHPEEAARRASIRLFKEHLRFARDFGCGIVATETGSLNPDFSFHPGNHSEESFHLMLQGLGEIVEEAEKFASIVAVEGVASFPACNPHRIRQMLDAVASQNLQILFDPVNLLTVENHQDQERIIQESFQLFGERIVAVHAKDFQMTGGRMLTVPLGKGLLDYRLLLGNLKASKPLMNIILEDTSPAVIGESMRFLRETYNGL